MSTCCVYVNNVYGYSLCMAVCFTTWNVSINCIYLLILFKIILIFMLFLIWYYIITSLLFMMLQWCVLQLVLLIHFHCHLYLSRYCHQSVICLCLSVYVGYCIATICAMLHDDSTGIGDDMLDEELMSLCSSRLLSLHSNNRVVYWVFACPSGSCVGYSFSS